ncbi:MAG TPA: hypothetical protein VFM34_11895 [Moraxellaceae bacterium]|nr:hypothetical protein [Moraxellaceae bacterium]
MTHIHYYFTFDDGLELRFDVNLDRSFDSQRIPVDAPEWTRLGNNQCSNCPLSGVEHSHCPAALDLDKVARDFQKLPAHTKANVRVVTPEREYVKRVGLEEGVRALMGLIMATSACPVFGALKANARMHLPFATPHEFITRSASMYLMRQYFIAREGGTPDWELKGLVKTNEQLQLVNHAFWQRTVAAFQNDANSKALLSFFTLSSSVSSSLDAQLAKVKPIFLVPEPVAS